MADERYIIDFDFQKIGRDIQAAQSNITNRINLISGSNSRANPLNNIIIPNRFGVFTGARGALSRFGQSLNPVGQVQRLNDVILRRAPRTGQRTLENTNRIRGTNSNNGISVRSRPSPFAAVPRPDPLPPRPGPKPIKITNKELDDELKNQMNNPITGLDPSKFTEVIKKATEHLQKGPLQ